MTSQHAEILKSLEELSQLSNDVRFGQMMANLGFLAEDLYGHGLWDIEDDALLAVIDKHRTDLLERRSVSDV